MKLTIFSDVHLEFHQDQGKSFLDSFGGETVIVAGDLGLIQGGSFHFGVERLCRNFQHVIIVLGNHEYYFSTRLMVEHQVSELKKQFPNLHILDNQTITIEGQRFVGTTLWFEETLEARSRLFQFSDGAVIKGLNQWVWDANRKSKSFLRKSVRSEDIVITHHIPIAQGSDPRWAGTFLQPFFVCPMDDVIADNKPKLWVYGHTHDSHDFTLCETRFVCNPFGYVNSQEQPLNRDFDWGKFIDVP